ncbi:MAG: hypothetical protein HRU40_04450 [Saprospiraceae bacterium]|nr:hypothetical protein [Saprospiraceae bacterium]
MKSKNINWKEYAFEFLSIFIAVILAFALSSWNDNRRERQAESKILIEILNGIQKDKVDFLSNTQGHKAGIEACQFWRKVLSEDQVTPNSSIQRFYILLTRDFITIQNASGYETLKAKGFEIIDNDSLRSEIISLYEFDYQIIEKLEEEYHENQFQKNYFRDINRVIAPHLIYKSDGSIESINLPIKVTESERKILLSHLLKIEFNRNFLLDKYDSVMNKIDTLNKMIENELNQ